MKHTKLFEEFLNENTSGEIFNPKRGKTVKFDHPKHPELSGEFFDLIATAYAEIGGHSKIKTPADVFGDKDWNYWEGVDLHGTKDFDMIMFGKKTKYGIKYSGVGHDGTKDAKRAYISTRGKELNKLGFYIEVSGKIAEILLNSYDVPVISDEDTINKVLGKNVTFIGTIDGKPGNGWYSRKLGGSSKEKILLGRPKI